MGRISEQIEQMLSGYRERGSANIGAGAYPRAPAQSIGAHLYRVRAACADGEFATIGAALAQWCADKQGAQAPRTAIIDIADSETYHEVPRICLEPGEQLQLRAASMARPVLRMVGGDDGASGQLRMSGAPGSRLLLDGLLIAGGGIEIDDGATAEACSDWPRERFLVTLRHCTLVPGWEADAGTLPRWRAKASVLVRAAGVGLRVEHSIVGPIRVARDLRRRDLLALHVGDSVVDAGHAAGLAITDGDYGSAPARGSFVRSTVIGVAQLEEVARADSSVFLGPLLAGRRDVGSVRYCYLEQGSRTPQRQYCQPDPALQTSGARARVRPRYLSLRYATPGYCQLAPDCAREISCGGDDDAGMGAFHKRIAPSGVPQLAMFA
jgi:hypothetical protein